MSKKRNIAVKKFKSKYIAFIDSDAYPNKNWLKLATKYLKQKKGNIVGGPGIPFLNQSYSEKICYLSKRSYFVSGYLNFRKYKAKKRYCDWLESCNLIMEKKFFLKYGGMGHTMAIHSTNEKIILEFGLKKPAFRVLVNTPTSHGSIGLTTGLDPSLTLGCGGYGGNITSDNITPRHLLNIKRLAYGIDLGKKNSDEFSSKTIAEVSVGSLSTLQSGQSLSLRIDEFLTSRGYRKHSETITTGLTDSRSELMPEIVVTPAEFVCEEDVRNAIKETRNIVINEQSIVTPAARDLAGQHNVFIQEE